MAYESILKGRKQMKLNNCKCGNKPIKKSKKSDSGKLRYFVECPNCKKQTIAYYAPSKQKAQKEWNALTAR
jgi:hypothetical protein